MGDQVALHSLIPRDPDQNLACRRWLLEKAYASRDTAEEIRIACSRDQLFFVNAFLPIYEPRVPAVLPWITWPGQEHYLNTMNENTPRGDESDEQREFLDVVVVKSRTQGATWGFLAFYLWRWCFFPYSNFGLVTRNEDLCDRVDDPDTLMWKLDFMHKHLPVWLRPELSRTKLKFKNNENQSTIFGYSATSDVGRGGRKLSFAMDELAAFDPGTDYRALWATQYVCKSRIIASTYTGTSGAYYDMAQDKESRKALVVLDWKENPLWARGRYRSEGGSLIVEDRAYWERRLIEHIRNGGRAA